MNVTIMVVKVTVSYFGNINGNFCILNSNYLSGQSNNELKMMLKISADISSSSF